MSTVLDTLISALREMARKGHDEADRLYHAGAPNGGYGRRCYAIGVEDALKAIESAHAKAEEGVQVCCASPFDAEADVLRHEGPDPEPDLTKTEVQRLHQKALYADHRSRHFAHMLVGYRDYILHGDEGPRYSPGSARDHSWQVGVSMATHDFTMTTRESLFANYVTGASIDAAKERLDENAPGEVLHMVAALLSLAESTNAYADDLDRDEWMLSAQEAGERANAYEASAEALCSIWGRN